MSLTFIIRLTVILLSAFTLVLTAMLSFADQLPLWLKIVCTVVPGAFTYLAGNLPSLIETERAQNAINTLTPRNTFAAGHGSLLPTEPNVVISDANSGAPQTYVPSGQVTDTPTTPTTPQPRR